MLLEMASGNFFYRLKRTSKNDNLEAISVLLNMLAEEIQETLIHQGYVNSNRPLKEIIQMSFILDASGCIELTNEQSCLILSMPLKAIIGKPFEVFLETASKKTWQTTWTVIKQKDFKDLALELKFITHSGLVIPKICYITTYKNRDISYVKTLISVIHYNTNQQTLDPPLKRQVNRYASQIKQQHHKRKLRLSFEDIKKIRQGHTFIINNLDMDFPTLKDFALQLGTNEFKLKYGFKELYGTTIHRFLMEERLIKSKMMIQFTQESLKHIAQLTGFKSMSHFSRTFKNRFGYTPSNLRKQALNSDE